MRVRLAVQDTDPLQQSGLDRRKGTTCKCAGAGTHSPTKPDAKGWGWPGLGLARAGAGQGWGWPGLGLARAGAGQGWSWEAAPGGRDGTCVRLVGCQLLAEEIAHGLLGREPRLVNVE